MFYFRYWLHPDCLSISFVFLKRRLSNESMQLRPKKKKHYFLVFKFLLHFDQRSCKQLPLFLPFGSTMFVSPSERMSYFSIPEIVKVSFSFLTFLILSFNCPCSRCIVYTFRRLCSVPSCVWLHTPGHRGDMGRGSIIVSPQCAFLQPFLFFLFIIIIFSIFNSFGCLIRLFPPRLGHTWH